MHGFVLNNHNFNECYNNFYYGLSTFIIKIGQNYIIFPKHLPFWKCKIENLVVIFTLFHAMVFVYIVVLKIIFAKSNNSLTDIILIFLIPI